MNLTNSLFFPFYCSSCLFICATSVLAQDYSYRYGESRVIQQSTIGLPSPSSSYIVPGSLSKSAQGVIKTGAQVNPNLPRVNHGAYIGTPGDNQYSAQPVLSGQFNNQIRRPQPLFRTAQPMTPAKTPPVNLYYPGQNERASESSSNNAQPSESPAIYQRLPSESSQSASTKKY